MAHGFRTAYVDLFNGARSYYAKADRDPSTVAFSATGLLAALTLFNVAALLCFVDAVSDLELTHRLAQNKALVIGASLGVIALHLLLLKSLGVYESAVPKKPQAWPKNVLVVAAVGLLVFVAAVVIGLTRR